MVQGFRDVLGFLQGFRAVDESRDFFSQAALGQSFFRFFFDRFGQSVDFFLAEEGEVFQVFDDVRIILVEPELIEFKGRCLFRVEPDSTAGGLAELGAVRFQHKGNGQAIGFGIAAVHLADRVDTGRDVAPLVGAADLQLDVVMGKEVFKVDGLENLVGKFRKGNACFQTAGNDFLAEHDVDAEQFAIIAEEIEEADLAEPVIVIDEGDVFRIAEKMHELGLQFFGIGLDFIESLELAFRLAAARVTDCTGTAANDDIRMMAGIGKALEHHERNQVADMHAVTRRVDTTIEGNALFFRELTQPFFICHLIDGTAPRQFINNIHRIRSFCIKNDKLLFIITT